LALSGTVTPRAKAIGAANTLWRPGDGTWHADNTDAPGFLATLGGLLDAPLKGQCVLVLGAGGAARAIVNALHTEGASILLANRTLSRAEALISEYQLEKQPLVNGQTHKAVTLKSGLDQLKSVDFVVNTTSLGYHGETFNLPQGAGKLFYDISYGQAAEGILTDAIRSGWNTQDGLSMLVYQAAFSFERWFGMMPDVPSGLDRVRRTIEAASK